MKLYDFGDTQPRAWFNQILEWSRKRISFSDNIEHVLLAGVQVDTTETVIDHPLGRSPRFVIEVAMTMEETYGIAGITPTRPFTAEKIYLSRATAGKCALLLF